MHLLISTFLLIGLVSPALATGEDSVQAPAASPSPDPAGKKECDGWFNRLGNWAREQAHSMRKAPPIDREALAKTRRRPLLSFLSPELQEKIAAHAGKPGAIEFTREEAAQIREQIRQQVEGYYVQAIGNDPHRMDWPGLFARAGESPDNPLNRFGFEAINGLNASRQQELFHDQLGNLILDFDEAAGIKSGVLTNGEWKTLNETKALPSTFVLKDMAEVIRKNYGKLVLGGGLAGVTTFVARPLISQWQTSTGAVSEVGNVAFQRMLAQKNAETFSLLAKKMVSSDQKALARQEMEKLFGKMTDQQFDDLVNGGIDQMMRAHFFEQSSNIMLMRLAREQRQQLYDTVTGILAAVDAVKQETARVARAAAWFELAGENDPELRKSLVNAKAAVKQRMEALKLQIQYVLIDRAYGFGKDEKEAISPAMRQSFELALDPTLTNVDLIWKTHFQEVLAQKKALRP